jgi:hypothetical protein
MSIKSKIFGLHAELIDDQRYEVFLFGEEHVSATIGTVNGSIAAPVYDYEIVSDSEIHIMSGGICWSDIRFDGDRLYVKRNGKPSIYKISFRFNKKARHLP